MRILYYAVPQGEKVEIASYDTIYIMPNGQHLSRCVGCGKVIQVNKPIIGSFHFCPERE